MNQNRIRPTLFLGLLYLVFGADISEAVNRNEIPVPESAHRTIAGALDNIKPPSVAGGTIKVKDILKLTFDIVAR